MHFLSFPPRSWRHLDYLARLILITFSRTADNLLHKAHDYPPTKSATPDISLFHVRQNFTARITIAKALIETYKPRLVSALSTKLTCFRFVSCYALLMRRTILTLQSSVRVSTWICMYACETKKVAIVPIIEHIPEWKYMFSVGSSLLWTFKYRANYHVVILSCSFATSNLFLNGISRAPSWRWVFKIVSGTTLLLQVDGILT